MRARAARPPSSGVGSWKARMLSGPIDAGLTESMKTPVPFGPGRSVTRLAPRLRPAR